VQSKGRGGLQSVVNLCFIETALNEEEERIVSQTALKEYARHITCVGRDIATWFAHHHSPAARCR
jgi:hypothetical protein